jgi:hypothetical protein
MSETKEWNTKEIRAFKEAFGTRNDFKFFSSEPPHDPNRAFEDAKQMLVARMDGAKLTLQAIIERVENTDNETTARRLEALGTPLSDVTDKALEGGAGDDADAATTGLIKLTDRWIAFEAHCISVNNEMAVGKNDAGVRKKLADRAANLGTLMADYLEAAKTLPRARDFAQFVPKVRALTDEAGADGAGIVDCAAFAADLEACKKFLRGLGDYLAEFASKEQQEKVYKSQLKQMYGINVSSKPTLGVTLDFPYAELLEVLAMVPPDHSMNTAMTQVVYENLWLEAGGDHSGSTIRISPLNKLYLPGDAYKNPETGEITRVDTLKATALHEIGHAVDAAYKIMNSNLGVAGCGGWEKQDPAAYAKPHIALFTSDMSKAKIADRTFTGNIANPALASIVASVLAGAMKPENAEKKITEFWTELYAFNDAVEFENRKEPAAAARDLATKALEDTFKENRDPSDFETCQRQYLAVNGVADAVDQLVHLTVLKGPDFWAEFDKVVVQDPQREPDDLIFWVQRQVNAFGKAIEEQRTQDREAKLPKWTSATLAAIPKNVDMKALSKYIASASPWDRDITGDPDIAGVKPSHEAYSGDAQWWRYSAKDRRSTSVSGYQWRSPVEWFAELYAVTWFKKVEPPGAVHAAIRPYLFGGHLTPDV